MGIILMLFGMFLFSAGDTLAKFLTDTFHPVQIIWFRQLGLILGVLVLLGIKGKTVLNTSQPFLQISRGVLAIASSLLFVFAIRYVSLVDAVAASFVAPFFLTIFGAFFLQEEVGVRRWSAVIVGFVGALIVVRPGMGVIHPTVMLVIIAAAIYSLRQVVGRLLADTDKTSTTIAYTAISSSCVISLPLIFFWRWPETSTHWWLLLAIGLIAAVGEVLVIKALEIAEAVVIAPIHYTLIIWGTVYGYLVFNQLPDRWTLLGAGIIVCAGIYTLYRSHETD